MTDYYQILGVSKTATADEIKSAYKKMAMKWHPDRNRNNIKEAEEKFKEIGKVYKVLSNPNSRKRYDQFGEDGLENSGDMDGFNPFDLFNNFGNNFGNIFNNFGFRQQTQQNNNQQKKMKGPNKEFVLKIKLEELYSGKSISINIKKRIKCVDCSGIGCQNESDYINCDACDGKGQTVQIHRMGPMIQQIVQPCQKCGQKGKMIRPGSECPRCNGDKSVSINKTTDFYIRPGSNDGDKIILHGESDWHPQFTEVGDLVIVIKELPSENGMKREGENLVLKLDIGLADALCGFTKVIKHFEDRYIKIENNNIIKPEQTMIIKGEGMPNKNGDMTYGDLVIQFKIIFPEKISNERKKYLQKLIPKINKQIWELSPEDYPNADVRTLEYYDKTQYMNSNSHNKVYSEDEDDEDGTQRPNIECAQQ